MIILTRRCATAFLALSAVLQVALSENRRPCSGPVPVVEHQSFHLAGEPAQLVQRVVAGLGIQAYINADVSHTSVRFDVEDVSGLDAMRLIGLATHTIFVPLDLCHILVIDDTVQNRETNLPKSTVDVSLAKLSPEERKGLPGLLKSIFGDELRLSVPEQANSVAINASSNDHDAVDGLLKVLYHGNSTLQLDVGIYEVSRGDERNTGVILPNSVTAYNVDSEANSILSSNASEVQQIISSGLASQGDTAAILAILIASGYVTGSVFNSPSVVFGGGLTETGVEWNSTSANLLLTSSESKSLQHVRLDLGEKQQGTFRLGERYPIKSSSYTTSSATSSTTTTIPQVQYQDLGLTLKVTPWVGGSDHVGLDFDLTLRSLSGSSINGIPVISNRRMSGLVSLHSGTSAVIVSNASSQDMLALTGSPGQGENIGATTNRDSTTNRQELVIVITPRALHIAHREMASPMIILPNR